MSWGESMKAMLIIVVEILSRKLMQIFWKQECPVEEWNQLVQEARAKVANMTGSFGHDMIQTWCLSKLLHWHIFKKYKNQPMYNVLVKEARAKGCQYHQRLLIWCDETFWLVSCDKMEYSNKFYNMAWVVLPHVKTKNSHLICKWMGWDCMR